MAEIRAFLNFCRFAGWLFLVGFSVGAVGYLVLMAGYAVRALGSRYH